MCSQLWPIRWYGRRGWSLSRNSARSVTFHGSSAGRVPDGKAADVTVADDGGRRALLEVAERDRGDAHVALAGQGDAAAELDHAVIADVDAVVMVAGPTPDPQVVARLKSSVHATRR